MENKAKSGFFASIFDIFFIMALCFATLLSSMLLNGAVIVGDNASGIVYKFEAHSLIMVVGVLAIYLVYLFKNSDKQLRFMVKEIYDQQDEPDTADSEPVIPEAVVVEQIAGGSK